MGKHDATFYRGHRIEPCRSLANRLHFHYGIPDRHLRITTPVTCFGYTPLGLPWPTTVDDAKASIDVRLELMSRKVG